MWPEICRVGSFPIRTYGVTLVFGVLVAVAIARRRAPMYGLRPDSVWDATTWLVLPGILGARLLYIAQNWKHYSTHVDELFSLRFEGLTSFGGLIGGFLGFLVWQRRTKTPAWTFLDSLSVPVLVAQAIGRVGCLLNGCCYGRITDQWYGAHFHGEQVRHVPSQLIDTVLLLIFAAALAWRDRKGLRSGQSFGAMLLLFGVSRFVYEFFRPDSVEGMATSLPYVIGPLTSAQYVSLGLAALGGTIIAIRGRSTAAALLAPEP